MGKVTAFIIAASFFGALSGCYGGSTGTQCGVCKDLSEEKSEGAEWTGEYIHEKFQCKLEGGKVMLEHEGTWQVCD
jgi:hypothetical protein